MTVTQESERRAMLTIAYRDFALKLGSHAMFKTHDKSMSDNLVQETFMKTWMYLVKNGKIDMMRGFLFNILNNLIVDEYRKRKTTSLDVLLEVGFEPHTENDNRSRDMFDGQQVFLLMKKLPKVYEKLMNMRYVEELSLKEMSTLTGQTKNATAVQLHRGLTKLRFLYAQQ